MGLSTHKLGTLKIVILSLSVIQEDDIQKALPASDFLTFFFSFFF